MAVSPPGQSRKLSPARWHGLFLSMLPTIRRHAEGAFEHLRHDDFDDAVSEVVAHALVVFEGKLCPPLLQSVPNIRPSSPRTPPELSLMEITELLDEFPSD